MAKYIQFVFIVLVCIFLDQWTKQIASDRLAASRSGQFDHTMLLEVEPEDDGETLVEFLTEELSANSAEEIRQIAGGHTRRFGGERLEPDTRLEAGDRIEIANRKVVVVPGYFDFDYARNPGAAFGILADHDSPWRLPFFIVVSLVALGVVIYILRGATIRQQLLIWSLSFIAGGALGNFIDRIRFGYVIDFIVWKYTDAYRWPTFNVADAFITVGVALMLVEIIRDGIREKKEEA